MVPAAKQAKTKKLTSQTRAVATKKLTICAIFVTLLIGLGPALSLASIRVAVLVSFDNKATQEALQAFQKHLKKSISNIDIDLYQLDKSAQKAAKAVNEIKEKDTDLVFALGSLGLKTMSSSQEIPVVACMILQKRELTKHQNVTGVALEFPAELQFEWMLRFLPETKNIGVLYNPAENSRKIQIAQKIAKKMGLNLVAREITTPKGLPTALKSMTDRVDLLWGISDKLVLNRKTAKNILLFSFRNRIPFVGLSAAWAKAGALFALDRDYMDIGRQCGEMALKILQGAPVKSIKPEYPRGVTYSLNMKTIEQMRLDVPKNLVQGANIKF